MPNLAFGALYQEEELARPVRLAAFSNAGVADVNDESAWRARMARAQRKLIMNRRIESGSERLIAVVLTVVVTAVALGVVRPATVAAVVAVEVTVVAVDVVVAAVVVDAVLVVHNDDR